MYDAGNGAIVARQRLAKVMAELATGDLPSRTCQIGLIPTSIISKSLASLVDEKDVVHELDW
jgi:hypothetical protein